MVPLAWLSQGMQPLVQGFRKEHGALPGQLQLWFLRVAGSREACELDAQIIEWIDQVQAIS